MVKLVEDLKGLPHSKMSQTLAVQNLYAFALSRRNKNGDRDKALAVFLKVYSDRLAGRDISVYLEIFWLKEFPNY